MRRFEFVDGTSSKFWEIDLSGTSFTVRFGKIGTNGQAQTKSFPTDAKAQIEHDKLVREKTGKGYVEVAGATPTPAVPPKAAPVVKAPAAVAAPTPEPTSAERPPESALVWTTELRAAAHPRRGYDPSPVKVNVKDAWNRIHLHFAKYASELQKLVPPANEGEAFAAALACLGAAHPPASPLAPPAESWVYCLGALADSFVEADRRSQAAIVDVWVATGGLGHALNSLLAATRWSVTRSYGRTPSIGLIVNGYPSTAAEGGAFRLRAHLANAPDTEWSALSAIAEATWAAPGTAESAQGLLAYLFPEHHAWSEALLRTFAQSGQVRHDPPLALIPALTDVAAIDAVLEPFPGYALWGSRQDGTALAATLLARHGLAAAPIVVRMFESCRPQTEERRSSASLLAHIGTSEALDALFANLDAREVLPAAQQAVERFPTLALRALAKATGNRGKSSGQAVVLLDRATRANPALARTIAASGTDAVARAILTSVEKGAPSAEEARPDELPAVLADPPWLRASRPPPTNLVTGLTQLQFEATSWAPGERERWADLPWHDPFNTVEQRLVALRLPPNVAALADADDPALLALLREANPTPRFATPLRFLPWRLTRHILREVHPSAWYEPDDLFRYLLATHGWEALYALEPHIAHAPQRGLTWARPFGTPRLANIAAHAYHRTKTARAAARAWLLANPEGAATGLIPDVAAWSPQDRPVEAALRLLVTNGHEATVLAVADRYPPGVTAAVRATLDFDPLLMFPQKRPKLPEFWSPAAFTRPVLRSGKSFSLAAMEPLGQMLAFATPDLPYAGLAQVKEACTPASLAAFAWDLFQAWQIAGWPSKEAWAFRALGTFGDDGCARKLAALVRTWPGEGAHARAVNGLDVLADLGTDVALMHLNGIAQKVKFKALQERAREKVQAIADARGLTADELADRLVPDLGLDAHGTLALDFGPRQFTVGFDPMLKPFVRDASGKALSDLPKPGVNDDADKAAAAQDAWKTLKKDVKTLASQQLLRLELAMCARRRWSSEVFTLFLADHPLLRHVVRRLVWGLYDAQDVVVGAFRIAEDGTPSDGNDDALQIPNGARIGVAHPLELPEALAAQFGQILADYQILQPFRQLGREVFRLTPAEAGGSELVRYEGLRVPTPKALGLASRGWRRGAVEDGGCWHELLKPLPGDLEAVATISPGILVGAPDALDTHQTLQRVFVTAPGDRWNRTGDRPLSTLDVIAVSELIRDLEGLRE